MKKRKGRKIRTLFGDRYREIKKRLDWHFYVIVTIIVTFAICYPIILVSFE